MALLALPFFVPKSAKSATPPVLQGRQRRFFCSDFGRLTVPASTEVGSTGNCPAMRELSSKAIATWLLLMAAGCQNPHVYTDVSGDPQYNPGGIVGRCFYLREGAYLLAAENQRPKQNAYERLAGADERFYPAMSAFESGTWDRGRYDSAREIVAVVPAGTMVCIRKIVRDESLKDKPLRPVAAIID